VKLVLLVVTALGAAWCQSREGAITGIVTDSSKAAVPQVEIAVRNLGTNIAAKARTSEAGTYTVLGLAPGRYELTAERQGFRTYKRTNITVEVEQIIRQDIELPLGQVSESIVVTAEIAPLNTEAGAVKGDVIVQSEIQEMPLQGRNYTDLAFLVAGVTPAAEGAAGSGMNANGARADNSSFYVEGTATRDPLQAQATTMPNLDAVQEFKMEVSGYSAEYGKIGGGVMNMALRSGANRFHGIFSEYVRNGAFDARGFFDQKRLELLRNQFGATLSGPVQRDRTFFMASWESVRQSQGTTVLSLVPTALERKGDFSQSTTVQGTALYLRDPLASGACTAASRAACFPGNAIPASRIRPLGSMLAGNYPLPNRNDAAYNYSTSADNISNSDTIVLKLDHRLSGADNLALRYQTSRSGISNPFSGSTTGLYGSRQDTSPFLAGITYSRTVTPRLLLEARGSVNWMWMDQESSAQAREVTRALGAAAPGLSIPGEFPRVNVLNYPILGENTLLPYYYAMTDFQGSAKMSWVASKHVLKWGGNVSRIRMNRPYADNVRGTVAFQAYWTNHPIGDMLLGLPNNSNRAIAPVRTYLRYLGTGLFVNDDFRVTRFLTLNLGLRYEIDFPPVDRYDHISSFVPGIGKIVLATELPDLAQLLSDAKLTGMVGLAKDYGLRRSLVYPNYRKFAPRFGVAWRPFGGERTVLRGGYGIFYAGNTLQLRELQVAYPFSISESYTRVATNPNLLTLSDPYPASLRNLGAVNATAGYQLRAPAPYLQTYNVTLERDLGRAMVLEIGYMGSRGVHLTQEFDLNQPLRSSEAYMAGGAFSRPVAGLTTINYLANGSNSFYSAGAVTLRRRARGNLFYRVNYVYAKSLDQTSDFRGGSGTGDVTGIGQFAQNSRDLKAERGRSSFDRGHTLTAAFSWQLPVGRNRALLANAGALVNAVAGGWQLSGTATAYTGAPFTVITQGANQELGDAIRPNRVGKGVPDASGRTGTRGVDYSWFNLADFVQVPTCASRTSCAPDKYGFTPFGFGNSGRNILDGPDLWTINLGSMKNFRLRERHAFQFRYELFNIVNHPNLNLPNKYFNTVSGGRITAARSPRQMQFALRYTF
jgi:hypothetical protein